MKFTRRKFIGSSAMAAAAVALGHAAGGTVLGGDSGLFGVSDAGSLSYLKREHFEPFINSAMRVTSETGKTAVIRLRQAVDLTNQVNQDRGLKGESFRLSFDALRKEDIPQGMCHFEHEKLGQFSLFLAPVGGSGIHCEAIINRIG